MCMSGYTCLLMLITGINGISHISFKITPLSHQRSLCVCVRLCVKVLCVCQYEKASMDVWLYVCVCVWEGGACMQVYVFTNAFVVINMYMCFCAYMHTCLLCACLHTCLSAYMQTCFSVYACIYTCLLCACMHTCMFCAWCSACLPVTENLNLQSHENTCAMATVDCSACCCSSCCRYCCRCSCCCSWWYTSLHSGSRERTTASGVAHHSNRRWLSANTWSNVGTYSTWFISCALHYQCCYRCQA